MRITTVENQVRGDRQTDRDKGRRKEKGLNQGFFLIQSIHPGFSSGLQSKQAKVRAL
jgi:hypothetical protein